MREIEYMIAINVYAVCQDAEISQSLLRVHIARVIHHYHHTV